MCDVIQLGMDVVLHVYIKNASLCWACSFLASIIFRHSFHHHYEVIYDCGGRFIHRRNGGAYHDSIRDQGTVIGLYVKLPVVVSPPPWV